MHLDNLELGNGFLDTTAKAEATTTATKREKLNTTKF